MNKPLLVLLLAVGISGCATRSDFSAISSKNINVSNLELKKQDSLGKVSGEDCKHIIIFIPTKLAPSIEEALDNALSVKGGNILLDATAKYHNFYIPYLYGQECWNISGEAYDTYKK